MTSGNGHSSEKICGTCGSIQEQHCNGKGVVTHDTKGFVLKHTVCESLKESEVDAYNAGLVSKPDTENGSQSQSLAEAGTAA